MRSRDYPCFLLSVTNDSFAGLSKQRTIACNHRVFNNPSNPIFWPLFLMLAMKSNETLQTTSLCALYQSWETDYSGAFGLAHRSLVHLSNVYKITVQRVSFTAQHVRVRRLGKGAKHAPYTRACKMAPATCSFWERSILRLTLT